MIPIFVLEGFSIVVSHFMFSVSLFGVATKDQNYHSFQSTSISKASPVVGKRTHSNIVISRDSPIRSSKLGGDPEETSLMNS